MIVSFGAGMTYKDIAEFCASSIINQCKRGQYSGIFFKSHRDCLHCELYMLIHDADDNFPLGNYFRCVLDIDTDHHRYIWKEQYHMCSSINEL